MSSPTSAPTWPRDADVADARHAHDDGDARQRAEHALDVRGAAMPFGHESRKISLGSKPHLLVGTAFGTLATFYAFFEHYRSITDESGALCVARRPRGDARADGSVRVPAPAEAFVWFGIRSDGRCGRDFDDTMCGKGHCCSSHGWCGHGDEYCSVSMGCQNGCAPASAEDEAKRENDEHYRHQKDVSRAPSRAPAALSVPLPYGAQRQSACASRARRRSLPALNPRADSEPT